MRQQNWLYIQYVQKFDADLQEKNIPYEPTRPTSGIMFFFAHQDLILEKH